MSGVYIPGFKKPTSKEQCKFFDYAPFRADYCALFNTCKGADSCPLIAVPDHGRLIDADELLTHARPIENFPSKTEVVVYGVIACSPTIIPAESEGE